MGVFASLPKGIRQDFVPLESIPVCYNNAVNISSVLVFTMQITLAQTYSDSVAGPILSPLRSILWLFLEVPQL